MNAQPLFRDQALLKKKLANFFEGRMTFLEEFEGRYGRVPEAIRGSLPYVYTEPPQDGTPAE